LAIPGAFVAVWDPLGVLVASGVTNGTGHLDLGYWAAGNYTVQAQAAGYASSMGSYAVAVPTLIMVALRSVGGGMSLLPLIPLIFIGLALSLRRRR